LFALLIPLLGIGAKTAVVVLVLYNQFLLIRNFLAGLNSVDPIISEAALGMGLSYMQIMRYIKIPLAFPAIMAGVRIAVVSTIGIATIAAVINAGGIGVILFDGLRTLNSVKILWGAVLCGTLSVGAHVILSLAEKWARRKLHC
jgi:osmoprotectant transport system permease protein